MTDHNEKIKRIIDENSGKVEIRVNCFNCEGSQKDTLSINTKSGIYHCFRCGLKGNALQNGFSDFSEKSAQDKAISMLSNAYPVNVFPYLQNKQVKAYEGIREYQFKNGERCLLIPVMNHHNEIVSLQIIKENGYKTFLSGTKKKGNFFRLNGNKMIFICEGYATGASIHEATGGTVYVVFDAGNLSYVLDKIAKNHDDITICADNDHKREDNLGLNKAISAALQYENVKVAYPTDIEGTDFNDMFIEKGLQAVIDRIAQAERPDKDTLPNKINLEKISQRILSRQQKSALNKELLPPILDEYVKSLSLTTSADPTMIIQSVLCMLSSMIGKRIVIPYPNYFQDLYPVLWCLSINESGSFKTTALNLGSRIAKHKGKEIDFQLVGLQNEMDNLENPKKDELKRYENFIREKNKENPILPDRTTAEGLISIIETKGGSEHTGGQIICSEFAEWTHNLNKSYNTGYKQLLTSLFDVPDNWKYTTKTGGTMILNRPFITLNAVSTLEWVSGDISQDDVSSGFFARFLLFYPPPKNTIPPALPTIRNQDNSIEDEIKAILETIRESALFREYQLSESAKDIFNYIHKQIYEKIDNLPDNLSKRLQPYVKRWSPYILKIASLFQPFFDFESLMIEDNALMSAFEIVNYCVDSTIMLFENELGESEQQKKQRLILEYIAKQGGQTKRQKIISSKTLAGSAMEYDNVLNTLIDSGFLETEKQEKKTEWLYRLIGQGF